MGGAADLPERSSSPLKRPASSMEPAAEADDNEDVDMITAPASATHAPDSADPDKEQGDSQETVDQDSRMEGNPEAQVEGTVPSITMEQDGILEPPASIEAHVKTIKTLLHEMNSTPLEENQTGYIVSRKWLQSVLGDENASKHGEIEISPESITPVDNSDIIWELITDPTKGSVPAEQKTFIRLKAGYDTQHFEIFPKPAWDLLMRWPGLKEGQFPIIRKTWNSAPVDAMPNVSFELHPPVFTIHRLWSANSPIPIDQWTKVNNPPPSKLARSRTTRYMQFLDQAKRCVRVDLKTRVKVWRIPEKLPAGNPSTAGPTPPDSPEDSSEQTATEEVWNHALVDVGSFLQLEKGVDREALDIVDQTMNPKYNGAMNLATASLTADQAIVLDEHIEGNWYVSTYSPAKASENLPARTNSNALTVQNRGTKSGRASPAPQGPLTRGRTQKSGRVAGSVGLGNLGNTCYMNAALQNVRNVEELTKYFLSGEWEKEINRDNVLGHNGDVAAAYAHLLKEIYSDPTRGSVTPRNFKSTVGRYAPAFSGYGQQDSQEFVGFLLDGLQEDLSRIKKKPYIEKPDSTDDMINDPEAIRKMAAQVWDITKKRDDSVIADLFTGLYKSTLVCPECGKVSITFDPFNNLTLPLPVENKWTHTIKFVPLNDKPISIEVELEKQSSIKALKEFVSSRTGVPVERMIGAEDWKLKFYKVYADLACASEEIGANDTALIYELESEPTNWNQKNQQQQKMGQIVRSLLDDDNIYETYAERMVVPVVHRKLASSKANSYGRRQFVLMPHFITVTPEEARSEDAIRRKVLEKVATFTKHEMFAPAEESETSDGTEPELIGTNGSDLESSGEGKVVAHSVQGEEDMVDVTMKDAGETKTAKPVGGQGNRPVKAVFNHKRPSWIDPSVYLPSEMQNLFELGFYSESGVWIPTGHNTVSEEREYPRLSTRAPEANQEEDQNDNATNGTASNEDSSSDEKSQPSVEAPPTRMADESDEEPASPVVNIPHRPKQPKANTHVKGGRKKLKPGKTYGKKGNKRLQRQQRQAARQATLEPETPPESEMSSTEEGPLIRLKEGLIVDWNEDAYDTLFGDGLATFKKIETLPDPVLAKAHADRSKRRKHGITLDQCLDEFERDEILSEQDMWYCPRCKKHQRASKKFDLWKTPDILVIHLKRFSSSGWRRDKLEVLVDFPLENLDLTQRVLEKEDGKQEVYDLIGVDCHWGGLGGGHYTAHARNFVNNQWYTYNDSSVSKTSPDRVVDASAYLLFYRRRSDEPLGGPRFKEIVESFNKEEPSDDEMSESGEDQRLDGATSRLGPSGANSGAAANRQQAELGGNRTLGGLHGRTDTSSDDGAPLLSSTAFRDDRIHRSIEDEAIDMTGASRTTDLRPLVEAGWSFEALPSNDEGPASPLGSGAATDEAQHDSSGDEADLSPPTAGYEPDTDLEIPGAGVYKLPPPTEGDMPDAPSPLPPYAPTSLEREDVEQMWQQKHQVHEVPAEGEEDTRSLEVAEIHLTDANTKLE